MNGGGIYRLVSMHANSGCVGEYRAAVVHAYAVEYRKAAVCIPVAADSSAVVHAFGAEDTEDSASVELAGWLFFLADEYGESPELLIVVLMECQLMTVLMTQLKMVVKLYYLLSYRSN